jgi:hypothetical protein
MPGLYTDAALTHRYKPQDRILFSHGGHFAMTAEAASRMAVGLVEIDRETETYHRVQCDPEEAWRVISGALARSRSLSPVRSTGNTRPWHWRTGGAPSSIVPRLPEASDVALQEANGRPCRRA